jgi:chitinase
VNETQIGNSARARLRRARVGVAAITTVIAAAAAGATPAEPPAWQVDVYYAEGSIVSYHGQEYAALVSQIDFPGTGWDPSVARLWKPLSTRSGERWLNFAGLWFARTNTESRCALAWNAANVYTSGAIASVNGIDYRANWWTQGESPLTHTSTSGGQPWTAVGSCAEHADTASGSKAADSKDGVPPDVVSPPPSQRAVQASAADHQG